MAEKAEAAERQRVMKDEVALTQLIKLHIKEEPHKTSLAWQGCSDLDKIVADNVGFLTAVALTGHSLSKKVLVKCLKKVWTSHPSILNDFAEKLCEAQRYCREKCKNVRSGAKTHEAVLQVIQAYGKKVGCSSPSLASSPSLQESPEADQDCVIVEDDSAGGTPPMTSEEEELPPAWKAAVKDSLRARNAELAKLKSVFGGDLPSSTGAASSSQAMPQPEPPILIADSPVRRTGSSVAAKVLAQDYFQIISSVFETEMREAPLMHKE